MIDSIKFTKTIGLYYLNKKNVFAYKSLKILKIIYVKSIFSYKQHVNINDLKHISIL